MHLLALSTKGASSAPVGQASRQRRHAPQEGSPCVLSLLSAAVAVILVQAVVALALAVAVIPVQAVVAVAEAVTSAEALAAASGGGSSTLRKSEQIKLRMPHLGLMRKLFFPMKPRPARIAQ